jgi:DNA-directed RNA polymerase specialized sigma24 family protein
MSRDRRASARPDHLPGANRPTTVDRTTETNADLGDRAGTVLDPAVVIKGIGRLTPDHRAALIEVYYRGRTVVEASRALGIPASAVKSRLYDALRSLRLIFEEEQHAQRGNARIGPGAPVAVRTT